MCCLPCSDVDLPKLESQRQTRSNFVFTVVAAYMFSCHDYTSQFFMASFYFGLDNQGLTTI